LAKNCFLQHVAEAHKILYRGCTFKFRDPEAFKNLAVYWEDLEKRYPDSIAKKKMLRLKPVMKILEEQSFLWKELMKSFPEH
jgi:hypothetical protein